MAKLATQNIVIQISRAVPDSHDDQIAVLDQESIDQLREAVEALAGDQNVVVELIEG